MKGGETCVVEERPPNQTLTRQEAAAILARYQEPWNRAALPELLDGFTDDITVDFADLPTIKGKGELDQIIRARLARQQQYRLTKTLRFVSGDTIVGSWVADWIDGVTGRPMKGRGIEFIEMRDGKCARWEATFNARDAEAPGRSQFT
jgi:ketosteroid isomerase-like protein